MRAAIIKEKRDDLKIDPEEVAETWTVYGAKLYCQNIEEINEMGNVTEKLESTIMI